MRGRGEKLMDVSRVSRLLKLITILKSGREYDADRLAGELGVSRRTFFRDLKSIENAGIPYQFERNKKTYSISASFFLPALHLDLSETLALLMMTRKLLSREVHPMHRHAMSAAMKIESNLPAAVLKHCGALLDGISIQWPETTSVETTADLFAVIQRSLAEKLRIRIRYDSVFDRAEIDVLLEPLRLVFMSRGWYLLAYSLAHGEVRTFKLDRMVWVNVTEAHFEPRSDFDEKSHFGDAWRMIPDGTLYDIRLRFSSLVAASVEEVRWHHSQCVTRLDDKSLLFEAKVDGLREICSWILGYGDQVEVLAPSKLRAVIRQMAERMVQLAQETERRELS